MADTLDDFVQEITEQILEETKKAYGETAFNRWSNPLYRGPMENPDGHAIRSGACGDTMAISLRFEDDRVKEASFQTDACGSSTVCGSFAAELSIGKSPAELMEISGADIIEKMGGIPKEDEHLASLASETLHQALEDYLTRQNRQAPTSEVVGE